MTDLITGLAAPILETLSSLATWEFLELYHLRDGVATLKSTLPEIEQLLNLLEENQPEYWLKQRQAATYDVEDLISSWEAEDNLWEMKTQVRKFVLPFPTSNLLFKHRMAKELRRITATLGKIISEGRENKTVSLNNESQHRNTWEFETGALPPNVIVGRESERKKIIHHLLKDEETSIGGNVTFIPIVGQRGMGKTFLAQLVYKHFNENRKHFDFRTWVWVTENFHINKIFNTIVETDIIEKEKEKGNLNPDVSSVHSLTLENLQGRVKKILTGKKFLIVLDDLWNYDPLQMDYLIDFLRLGAKGSKVLVTSWSKTVSNLKESIHPINLESLDDDQSWSLFEKFAFKEDDERQELEECGRQIVKRCHGVPLIIKALGVLLCGQKLPSWSTITKSQIWEDKGVEPALRLSYDRLPSPVHKKCFAYCALFPKRYLFDKDELVKLWMAEGYVQPKQGQKSEDAGAQYFDDLSERTFFERSNQDEGKHMMHDLIHDLAQTVSKHFCSRVVDNEISSFDENTRHVSLLAEQVEQPTLEKIRQSKRLHTLLFPVPGLGAFGASQLLFPFQDFGRFWKAQRELFHSLVYMHVLDLNSSALQTLPDSIGKLKLLRYLDVSKTELKELPDSICNLYHLQTLKLLGCPFILSLPKKFQFLVHLRHLELDEMFWCKVRAIPQSIGRLTNLHNLHKFQVGCNTGYKLEELKNMEHLTGKLHISNLENSVNAGKEKTSAGEANVPQVNSKEANLEGKKMIDKVVYEWSDSKLNLQNEAIEKKVLEDLEPQPRIKEIRICHYRGSEFPSWMGGGRLQDLVTVVLTHCERIKILSLGELPHLQEVHLESMLELEEWQEEGYESLDQEKTKEENYQPLRSLTVSNCPKLTKLPCCFSKLIVLKITKCEKLENIPFGPMSFITLEDNAVMKHWGDEVIFKNFLDFLEGHDEPISRELEEVISEGHNESIPRELEEVISEGHNEPIPRENYSLRFSIEPITLLFLSRTINLKIVKCPALSTLPGGLHPQKLEISECGSLSALPEENCAGRLTQLALDSCQGDTLLGTIPSSPELLSLMITNISDIRCLPTFPGLPKLETLHIHDFPDLEYLSTPENRLFERFTCLAILSIKNCPKLMTLPAEGLPTSLRYLSIGPCDCLNSFGPPEVLVKLNSLRDLYIEDCPALQSLPDEGLLASLLHLSIKGCPSLMKNCAKDGSDWPKIKDISDLEIEKPSTETPGSSSGACFNISSLRGHSKGKKVLE